MTGAGTQDNPYIIETWTDLFDCAQSSDNYGRLANDLDGNDYNGGIMPLRSKFPSYLDGAGHTIRNIYNITGSPSSSYNIFEPVGGEIKNVTFENVITDVPFISAYVSRMLTFENCKFSVAAYHLMTGGATLKECTISCDLIAGFTPTGSAFILERCGFKAKIKSPRNSPLFSTCKSCRVEAELQSPISNFASSYVMDVSNSVLAIKPHPDETASLRITGDALLPSVVDSDLWGSAPKENVGDGIIFLSTQDMKNADALNVAGFQVVRVS